MSPIRGAASLGRVARNAAARAKSCAVSLCVLTEPLVLPYPPSLNRLYRTVRGRPILSKEARQYRAAVQQQLAGMRLKASSSPVALSIALYRPRRAGDADNALKALLDALNGLLWVDDSQIVEIHLWRRDDKARPRVELLVEEVPES